MLQPLGQAVQVVDHDVGSHVQGISAGEAMIAALRRNGQVS